MAKIDTTKIEGYAEMSAEDKLKALEEFDMPDPDYTGYVRKETADKYASEAADFKKKYKDLLSDEQRKQQEQDETLKDMKSELEKLRTEKKINEHTTNLIKLGYDEESAKKAAQATIDGDFSTVYELQSKFIADTKKNVQSEILKSTPAPNLGDGEEKLTKDVFKKLSLSERLELKESDPETFAELSK